MVGLLAGAKIGCAVFFGSVRHWRKSGAFVRAITKRLVFRMAARAPVNRLTGFQLNRDWCLGGYVTLAHMKFSKRRLKSKSDNFRTIPKKLKNVYCSNAKTDT